MRNVEAGTTIEAALFRAMSLPGGAVLFRRPPAETRPALGELIKAQPKNAELYSLRALEDEQQLDFSAAEADWKKYAESASEQGSGPDCAGRFLSSAGSAAGRNQGIVRCGRRAADSSEALTPPTEQQSWRAFERIFGVIQTQGLPPESRPHSIVPGWRAIRRNSLCMPAFWNFWWRKKITRRRSNWSRIIASNFRLTKYFQSRPKPWSSIGRVRFSKAWRVRTDLPAAVGAGTGEELFRSARPDPKSAQVSRPGAGGPER